MHEFSTAFEQFTMLRKQATCERVSAAVAGRLLQAVAVVAADSTVELQL
jgi:hypothetical protein